MLSMYYAIVAIIYAFTSSPPPHAFHAHECNHKSLEVVAEEARVPDTESDRLQWKASEKLVWADFQGVPDYGNDKIAALTSSAILYRHYCAEDGKLAVSVEAVFRKADSWVKPEAMTPHYLEHEQLHFDITELYARKLRKEFAKYDFECSEKWHLERVANQVLADWRNKEKEYDWDTKYSLDEPRQRKWLFKVEMMLMNTHNLSLKEKVEPIIPLKYSFDYSKK